MSTDKWDDRYALPVTMNISGETFVSYLNPLRLHFSGSFEAAVSTVNNDPVHYDNARFKPSYAEPQSGTARDELNGSFNPEGSGDWRLHGCTVTAAFRTDGAPVPRTDPVLDCLIADSDRRTPAKLVDLDPEQQFVSQIFGLELRIATTGGETLLRGEFEPAAFMDIWDRGPNVGALGDLAAGAMYQSVLTRLTWGDTDRSPFLRALRESARAPEAARTPSRGRLSVKFNVDGFSKAPGASFMMGRMVGTIGPAGLDEPAHFVAGRQFMAVAGPESTFFTPAGGVNFCAASVDRATRRVYLDLGNALPTITAGGPPTDLGDLALCPAVPEQAAGSAVAASGGAASAGASSGGASSGGASSGGASSAGVPRSVGVLHAATYTDPLWYPATAGIAVFPPDRPLTDAELASIDAGPLSVVATVRGDTVGGDTVGGEPPKAVISEPVGGVFVRTDQFVFRLDPGRTATASLYATRFGRPYPGAAVITVPVPGQLQPDSPLAPGQAPPVAVPADAIGYPVRVVTDERGRARLRIRASDPGRPRDYIDGQVYALCPVLEETIVVPGDPYPYNQWNFISLLVWSGFTPAEPPTWHGDIEPVMRQYANLYPVMRDFLDLGDYESVGAHAKRLAFAFGLDIDDPDSMPVTRDLSAAKRRAILRWLGEPGEDGKPLLGTPPRPAAAQPVGPEPAAGTGPAAHGQIPPHLGGKASAASRRPAARRGPRPTGQPPR
jgi:hypothetical protein